MPPSAARALVVVAAILAAMAAPPARAADGRPTIVAHRGTAHRPENTLAGISNADYHDAPWVEIDIRRTSDSYLRVIHDDILSRTTTCTGRVSQRTNRSLSGCRAVERWPEYRRRSASFDGRYRIPSLEAAIARAERRDVGLLLDVKTGARNRRLRERADRAGIPIVLQVRSLSDVAWLTARTRRPVGWCCRWRSRAFLDRLAAAGGSHIAVPTDELTRWRVNQAHQRGLTVHTWTVRAQNRWLPERYRSDGALRDRGDVAGWHAELAATGVDVVLADEPNLAP